MLPPLGPEDREGRGLASGQWWAEYLQAKAYWMPRKRHMAKIMRKSCRDRKKVIWSQIRCMSRGYFKQLKSAFLGSAETLSKAQPFLGT